MEVKILVFLLSSYTLAHSIADDNVLSHHLVIKSPEDVQDLHSKSDWWKTAIFYQIYPRSYMDSDGDGVGDLQGIINKLQHIKDMGASAAWLSPIYKSPGVDQGYDISNFTDIEPVYGNMTDLKNLVDKAHELGLKLILDYVPNHTSDQHEWFKQSVAKNDDYKDFYIWHNGKKDGSPPNNWISNFGGSAWEYNKQRKQYYYHQFATAQPDLNYRNKKVVEAMKDVLKFWLDFGIDGFRVDAVPFLFEDKEFRDEPRSGIPGRNADEPGYTKAIYTTHLDETYDMVYQWRAVIDEYNKNTSDYRVMMTEAYADTIEQTLAYYGNETTNGAHFTFNFKLMTDLKKSFKSDDVISAIDQFLTFLDKKYVGNWVLGNHDRHRVATRVGVESIDALNMLAAFLPGIQITYQGEEIGMEDGKVNCSQGFDPQAIKNCSKFDLISRDFERTPFHWDDTLNAGFSTGKSPWLPVSEKYKENNLKAQNVDGKNTHYNVYKGMSKFRTNFKNISYDYLSLLKLSENTLQITRKTNKGEYVYLLNSGDQAEKVKIFKDGIDLKVVLASTNSKMKEGDKLPTPVTLQPHESVILQHSSSVSKGASNPIKATLTLGIFLILMKFY